MVGLIATTFVMVLIELVLTFFGLTIVYLQLNLISRQRWAGHVCCGRPVVGAVSGAEEQGRGGIDRVER